MNATTARAAAAELGATVQAIALPSCVKPHAVTPTSMITRLSMYRTNEKLNNTPSKPIQVTIMEKPNGFVTPAISRKYVV